MNKYITKLDRLAAWVLFFGMIFYFISGYGLSKGIISQELAAKLHIEILSIIVIIAFVIHAAYASRLAFIRWKFWSWPIKIIWVFFFAGFLTAFIYLDQFYQPKTIEKAAEEESTVVSSDQTIVAINNNTAGETIDNQVAANQAENQVFTKEELAKYDGKNDNLAYVAVNGKVYDLTSIFKDGGHYSHYAGQELTNAFLSYHAEHALSKYPVIGKYQE